MPRRTGHDEPSPPVAPRPRRRTLVLDRDGARRLDAAMHDRMGVSGLLLMERASLGVAAEILARIDEGLLPEPTRSRPVLIVCGGGNNGGDGFAIARHLAVEGVPVEIAALAATKRGGDAAVMRRSAERLADLSNLIRFGSADPKAWNPRVSIVVDAIFGTGLDRPVEGAVRAAIEALDRLAAPIVAVDLPSGLDADTGEMLGASVRATVTTTFAAIKPAMLQLSAQSRLGEVVVVSLGTPEAILREFARVSTSRVVSESRAGLRAPREIRRPRDGDL
ncbi:MAG: NAD(P)H-hydrate epimerase [Phycisphaerales bacterium]|nr:NAD(P)H-hydrate epimerase [Planctomycetota bacterium]